MNLAERIRINRITQGGINEFETLFRDYYAMLCNYAIRFVSDKDTAEEIVQELFYKIWENKESFNIRTSVKSYLLRSVHNNCLLFLEHKAVNYRYVDYIKNSRKDIGSDASELIRTKEIQEIIDKTLNELPERTSKIFKLNRFEGLKYKEIAEQLSVSIKTVEANMGKALKLFRNNLKEYVEAS